MLIHPEFTIKGICLTHNIQLTLFLGGHPEFPIFCPSPILNLKGFSVAQQVVAFFASLEERRSLLLRSRSLREKLSTCLTYPQKVVLKAHGWSQVKTALKPQVFTVTLGNFGTVAHVQVFRTANGRAKRRPTGELNARDRLNDDAHFKRFVFRQKIFQSNVPKTIYLKSVASSKSMQQVCWIFFWKNLEKFRVQEILMIAQGEERGHVASTGHVQFLK